MRLFQIPVLFPFDSDALATSWEVTRRAAGGPIPLESLSQAGQATDLDTGCSRTTSATIALGVWGLPSTGPGFRPETYAFGLQRESTLPEPRPSTWNAL